MSTNPFKFLGGGVRVGVGILVIHRSGFYLGVCPAGNVIVVPKWWAVELIGSESGGGCRLATPIGIHQMLHLSIEGIIGAI